jgi:2-polyprenyl-3-methyl-5-hydroxy-6-metoxy-1,4-benzoquinol methylase
MSSRESTCDELVVKLVSVSCPLCGADDARVLYKPWNTSVDMRDVLSASGGVRGTQQIVKCAHCDLIYANPRLSPEEVLEGYASAADEIYVAAATGREATFRRCVQLVEKYSPRGKLLDVGCAAGFFVKAACDAGWDAVGVEPCQWLVDYGSSQLGVKIVAAPLDRANFPDDYFDVVTIWDVLEHVPDPVGELREVFRVLRPGGLLMVNFPDVGTWQAKLARKNWWFFLSVHLTYFTKNTLRTMLTKVGFEDFITRPHFQTLQLGHLVKMLGLYNQSIANGMLRVCDALRIDGLLIRYYASQTNVMCRKPRY